MAVLFDYPKKAEFNRIVPKSKFYERAKPSKTVRERFISEISQIVWRYKLAPETINLPARSGIHEIQVFSIVSKTQDLSEDVLRTIDKAIPSPIIFEIEFESKTRMVAAYKRQSDSDSSNWVVELYFATEWLASDSIRQPLPVVLDMGSLYDQFLRSLIDIRQRSGEDLRQLVGRVGSIRSKECEVRKLEARLQAEKQFNRKVELNSQLRTIRNEIASLSKVHE
jgi:Domain of unknown function (DUF4391)